MRRRHEALHFTIFSYLLPLTTSRGRLRMQSQGQACWKLLMVGSSYRVLNLTSRSPIVQGLNSSKPLHEIMEVAHERSRNAT